jgi:hypothetical protein
VRPNFDYANVRTTGLPLYPASGTRCLVFKTGYTYQNIELAETTWSIALVDKSS